MRLRFFFLIVITLQLHAQTEQREYYQLKTYSFEDAGQEALTDTYLKDAYLPALKRYGIEEVGVFKPRPMDTLPPLMTYVLTPFKNIAEFEALDDALAVDKTYQTAGEPYLRAAHDRPPYARVESILMRAFTDMPEMKKPNLNGPRKDRVYELRSYESPTESLYWNKVDMFNAGGEIVLFDKLGFNAVFYGEVLSGSRMPNLMYMTTFETMESRESHWDDFRNAPEWLTMKELPKYQNNVSHADIHLLYPTSYSAY